MSYGTTTGNSKGTWPIPKTSPFQLHDLVTIEIARKQYVRGTVLGTHDRDGDNLRIRSLEGVTRIIHKSSLTKLPDKTITPKLKPCPLCGGFPFIENEIYPFTHSPLSGRTLKNDILDCVAKYLIDNQPTL